VADHVVVAAEWGEVVGAGDAALGEGFAVVEVAVVGGLAASGEDTGWVDGLEMALLGDGGSPGDGSGGYRLALVGDGECPFDPSMFSFTVLRAMSANTGP
jgi:hypothetical protein